MREPESGSAVAPAGPDDEAVPMATAASWDQAEAKIYPAIITRPDIYQRVLTIVRLTVESLRELGTSTTALLAAAQRGPELVRQVLTDNGLPSAEIDLDLVARAALAMRHREVSAAQAARRRLRRVAQAQRSGQSWVVVEEHGDSLGDVFIPYHRLEVEVSSGRTLFVTARADEDFRAVLHAVEQLSLDLTTGAVKECAPGGVAATVHPDAIEREAHVRSLKRHLPSA